MLRRSSILKSTASLSTSSIRWKCCWKRASAGHVEAVAQARDQHRQRRDRGESEGLAVGEAPLVEAADKQRPAQRLLLRPGACLAPAIAARRRGRPARRKACLRRRRRRGGRSSRRRPAPCVRPAAGRRGAPARRGGRRGCRWSWSAMVRWESNRRGGRRRRLTRYRENAVFRSPQRRVASPEIELRRPFGVKWCGATKCLTASCVEVQYAHVAPQQFDSAGSSNPSTKHLRRIHHDHSAPGSRQGRFRVRHRRCQDRFRQLREPRRPQHERHPLAGRSLLRQRQQAVRHHRHQVLRPGSAGTRNAGHREGRRLLAQRAGHHD